MRKYFLVLLLFTFSLAEVRTYRQVTDVSTQQSGKVTTSKNEGNLFEVTYDVNLKDNVIIRTSVRRLDQGQASPDQTTYTITGKKFNLPSNAGQGGEVLVAIENNGGEILQLGNDFAFTSRASSFSQMVSGVYKRVN